MGLDLDEKVWGCITMLGSDLAFPTLSRYQHKPGRKKAKCAEGKSDDDVRTTYYTDVLIGFGRGHEETVPGKE